MTDASRPLYTIGYGGASPSDLLAKLSAAGVRTVVDVRLRPDKAAMGCYALAKAPDKGIVKQLASAGIGYASRIELGNPFMEREDWAESYSLLLEQSGELLTRRLADLDGPICLLCAEKKPENCHRSILAAWLAERGWSVCHLIPGQPS